MQILIIIAADWLMLPIIALAAYALLFKLKDQPLGRYQVYARIVMAGLTAYLVAKIAGVVYQPAAFRPFELLGTEPGAAFLNNPGFPSDHALFAMFLTLAVGYAVKSKTIFAVLVSLTIIVCVGRVLALVHTPLDVIGGILIACTGLVWYISPAKGKLVKQ